MRVRKLMNKRERLRKEGWDAESTSWRPSEVWVGFRSRMGRSIYPTARTMFGQVSNALLNWGTSGTIGMGIQTWHCLGQRSWVLSPCLPGNLEAGPVIAQPKLRTALWGVFCYKNWSLQPLLLRKLCCATFHGVKHLQIRKLKAV